MQSVALPELSTTGREAPSASTAKDGDTKFDLTFPNKTSSLKRAFSLVELLVVMAIVILLAVLTLPAISSINRTSSLNTATQALSGTLDLARQTAITQNRTVEVRFYKLPADGQPSATPSDYRGVQIFVVDYDTTNAVQRPFILPFPAVMATNTVASSLMDESIFPETSPPAGVTVAPAGSNYRYRSLRFKPDGSADLAFSGTWHLSLVNKEDQIKANGLPANYATIRLEAMTGRIKTERP